MVKIFTAQKILVGALLAGALVRSACAHPQDMGLLQAETEKNQIHFRLEMIPDIFASATHVEKSLLTGPKLSEQATALLAGTVAKDKIETPSGACDFKDPTAEIVGEKVRLLFTVTCEKDLGEWKTNLSFLSATPKGFELLVKLKGPSISQDFVATSFNQTVDYSQKSNHSWGEFVAMGIQHIGAVPSEWQGPNGLHLPDGIDHILFVIALVIAGGSFFGIIKTVTGFTLGHSITLALATFGVVHIPSRIVESAIALSIAFVAAESLFLKETKNRWRIALFFGLVHGLGFASALGELHLDRASILKALVGFNVGVELGQIVIISLTLPVVLLLRRYEYTRRFAIPLGASAICAAGAFWFIQRAFLVGG